MDINTIEELLSNFPRYTMESHHELGVVTVQDREGEWVHFDEMKSILEELLKSSQENT